MTMDFFFYFGLAYKGCKIQFLRERENKESFNSGLALGCCSLWWWWLRKNKERWNNERCFWIWWRKMNMTKGICVIISWNFISQHVLILVSSAMCAKIWHVIKKVNPGTFFKVDWKCRENLKFFWNAGTKTQTTHKCRDLLHI
jgi:hypothetical protein